jgi:glyoxylase-like metal-dependent hydrolase (beta-lactamase superfamily II)
MAENEIPPKPHPSLHLPKGDTTVEVSIINTTTDIVVPAGAFVQPVQKGHETMNMPTFAFLVKNKKQNKTIMFDLGCRKDWWNHAPLTQASIKDGIPGLNIPKNVNEILKEGGIDDRIIDAVIWSHWHWDHTGDLSLFPPSADLYVGPGFKEAFMPGYPAREDSPMLESDFKGRTVHEVSFSSSNKIGAFPSFDLFGDGSLFLLDVPGHAVGHISGFARTTPDTFVFIGGDVCHFGGSYRPTAYAPMPATIPSSVPMDSRFKTPCPGSIFQHSHRDPENYRTESFYKVTQQEGAWYVDPPTAQKSVDSLEDFDADENVFVCVAHDGGLIPVVDWFPKGTLNDWKTKGWKAASQWGFLNELPVDGKPGRERIAPGLVREGKVVSKEDA